MVPQPAVTGSVSHWMRQHLFPSSFENRRPLLMPQTSPDGQSWLLLHDLAAEQLVPQIAFGAPHSVRTFAVQIGDQQTSSERNLSKNAPLSCPQTDSPPQSTLLVQIWWPVAHGHVALQIGECVTPTAGSHPSVVQAFPSSTTVAGAHCPVAIGVPPFHGSVSPVDTMGRLPPICPAPLPWGVVVPMPSSPSAL